MQACYTLGHSPHQHMVMQYTGHCSCAVIGWTQMSSKHLIGSIHRDSPETPHSTGFCCVALRASTIKECEEIVCRIGEAQRLFAYESSCVKMLTLCCFSTYSYRFQAYRVVCMTVMATIFHVFVNKCKVSNRTLHYCLHFNQLQNTQGFLLIKTFNRKTCDNIFINSIKCSCRDFMLKNM